MGQVGWVEDEESGIDSQRVLSSCHSKFKRSIVGCGRVGIGIEVGAGWMGGEAWGEGGRGTKKVMVTHRQCDQVAIPSSKGAILD
jgi:hypothetical protein